MKPFQKAETCSTQNGTTITEQHMQECFLTMKTIQWNWTTWLKRMNIKKRSMNFRKN